MFPLPGRGQDTSSFLPKPEVILMADVVYYEQVIIIVVLIQGSPQLLQARVVKVDRSK